MHYIRFRVISVSYQLDLGWEDSACGVLNLLRRRHRRTRPQILRTENGATSNLRAQSYKYIRVTPTGDTVVLGLRLVILLSRMPLMIAESIYHISYDS